MDRREADEVEAMAAQTYMYNEFGRQSVNWNNASIWTGPGVPDDSNADVFINDTNNGDPTQAADITVSNAYTVGWLTVAGNELLITGGSLTATVDFDVNRADGQIVLGDGSAQGAGSISAASLENSGTISGVGVISGPITDDGVIVAGLQTQTPVSVTKLELNGPVTGTGTLEIGTAVVSSSSSGPVYSPWTLELGSSADAAVVFKDGHGVLLLDDPAGFTGSITAISGDQVELANTALSSVTGYSYSGDTLTIDLSSGSSLALKFEGNFNTHSFNLTAGSSQGAPSVAIHVGSDQAVRDHFDGGAVSDFLMENTNGQVVVGELSGGHPSYTTVAGLGPEWAIEGTGDFLGDGHSDFLIENTSGQVVVGDVSNGATSYTQVAALGPEWKFLGTGDFLGTSQDQFLIENTAGWVVVGSVVDGQAVYTSLGTLPTGETVAAVGTFNGPGQANLLVEANGQIDPTTLGSNSIQINGLGGMDAYGWKIVATGDFLGNGKDQFLAESSNGAVILCQATYISAEGGNNIEGSATITGLGPEWKFVGAGDYRGEGHDQFLIENSKGALYLGDYVGDQYHGNVEFTPVTALGSEWSFHG